MRALFLIALLASVAAPAVAAPQDSDRHGDRSDRSSSRAERADRPDRADRPQRAERPDRPERAERQQPAERPQRVEREARPERQVEVREVRQVEREARPSRQSEAREVRPLERISRVDSPDSVRNWRPAERRVRNERPTVRAVTREVAEDSVERTGRQAERRTIRERQDYMRARTPQVREPRVSPVPAEGTQPPVRVATRDRDRDGRHWRDGDRDGSHWRGDRDRNHHRWSGNWRNNHRYDWRHYRDRNRSIFRIGVYFDPFGWNYRRYNVGWRLWPSYYSSRYWLNDPWMYRLPYAPPGYRWIRYYDDAVLVDTWDGQIVDVIHNFFW